MPDLPHTIVLATENPGKLRELQAILGPYGVNLSLPVDLGQPLSDVEDGETYEANAAKKARLVSRVTGMPALADDSGLEVDALGGAPGLRSARWQAGEDTDRTLALLKRLEGVPEAARTARFVAVVALAWPEGRALAATKIPEDGYGSVDYGRGRLEGRIALAPRGGGGFGYDPVFLVTEAPYEGRLTLAELTEGQKNHLSHRARALKDLLSRL